MLSWYGLLIIIFIATDFIIMGYFSVADFFFAGYGDVGVCGCCNMDVGNVVKFKSIKLEVKSSVETMEENT